MTIPDWFCPVICAGLAMNELMPVQPLERKVIMHVKHLNKPQEYRFKEKARWIKKEPKINKLDFNEEVIDISNFEENEHISRPIEDNSKDL